jgi:hypothetical protein
MSVVSDVESIDYRVVDRKKSWLRNVGVAELRLAQSGAVGDAWRCVAVPVGRLICSGASNHPAAAAKSFHRADSLCISFFFYPAELLMTWNFRM